MKLLTLPVHLQHHVGIVYHPTLVVVPSNMVVGYCYGAMWYLSSLLHCCCMVDLLQKKWQKWSTTGKLVWSHCARWVTLGDFVYIVPRPTSQLCTNVNWSPWQTCTVKKSSTVAARSNVFGVYISPKYCMTLLVLCNSLQESTCPPLGPVVQITDDEAIRERFQSTTELREWKEQRIPLLKLPSIYLKLSKSRLTGWSTWRGWGGVGVLRENCDFAHFLF